MIKSGIKDTIKLAQILPKQYVQLLGSYITDRCVIDGAPLVLSCRITVVADFIPEILNGIAYSVSRRASLTVFQLMIQKMFKIWDKSQIDVFALTALTYISRDAKTGKLFS